MTISIDEKTDTVIKASLSQSINISNSNGSNGMRKTLKVINVMLINVNRFSH